MTGDRISQGESMFAGEGGSSSPYRVSLPEFEGPLDLLLHLCQTHEIDILNISIAFIAEKYIEYLEIMQNMSVEVAADYLVMAAHLAYLKSRELVPSPEPLEASEDGEEPVDPREELIRRLLQYQKYKHAAESLGGRPIEGRNVFLRGMPMEGAGDAGLAEHSVWRLLEHWAGLLKKAKPEHTHDVVVDRISIADRVNHIVDLLEAGKGMVRFEDLLGQNLSTYEVRHRIVVSLLAVLELARLRVIRIFQQESTGSFFLAHVEGSALSEARSLRVTSVKEHEQEETETVAVAETVAETETVVGAETVAETNPSRSEQPSDPLPPAIETSPAEATPLDDDTPQAAPPDAPPPESDTAASDPGRQACQDDVISVPSPASAETGEHAPDGQDKEEQETAAAPDGRPDRDE